jgi:hypothetical protein
MWVFTQTGKAARSTPAVGWQVLSLALSQLKVQVAQLKREAIHNTLGEKNQVKRILRLSASTKSKP